MDRINGVARIEDKHSNACQPTPINTHCQADEEAPRYSVGGVAERMALACVAADLKPCIRSGASTARGNGASHRPQAFGPPSGAKQGGAKPSRRAAFARALGVGARGVRESVSVGVREFVPPVSSLQTVRSKGGAQPSRQAAFARALGVGASDVPTRPLDRLRDASPVATRRSLP